MTFKFNRQEKLKVRLDDRGDMTISTNRIWWTVEIRKLPPDMKFEKVKWSILNAGYVFTSKLEKQVRKELE